MFSDLDRCVLISLTFSFEISLEVLLFLLWFGELWIRCLERESIKAVDVSLVFSYAKRLLKTFI